MIWRWFYGLVKRFVLFVTVVVASTRAFSWLFGYDPEVLAWTSQNRPLVATILVLSAIIFAMYDWLESSER